MKTVTLTRTGAILIKRGEWATIQKRNPIGVPNE